MNSLNQFFFGIYRYIALTVFLLGSLARFEREQYTWKLAGRRRAGIEAHGLRAVARERAQ